ncbi:MAG: peptide deformylase [Pseudomonadota bacterium]
MTHAIASPLPQPILPIIRMGHPTLRRVAEPVSFPLSENLKQLADTMVATMLAAPGVGLAAPQVNVPLRMLVYSVPAARIDDDQKVQPLGPQVLINPELKPLSDDIEYGPEGCLSIPGLKGQVPRYTHLGYRGMDLDGQTVEGEAFGFHARVLQHEVDHLDGVLYLDRMDDMESLAYLDVLMELEADAAAQALADHEACEED